MVDAAEKLSELLSLIFPLKPISLLDQLELPITKPLAAHSLLFLQESSTSKVSTNSATVVCNGSLSDSCQSYFGKWISFWPAKSFIFHLFLIFSKLTTLEKTTNTSHYFWVTCKTQKYLSCIGKSTTISCYRVKC